MVAALDTNRRKIAARLRREGWTETHGGDHHVFTHPEKPGRIVLPRHRVLSIGVGRAIAKQAGWM
jgi:predicted RNA binding protein YcfA (HicA-like mRNA interferase family)